MVFLSDHQTKELMKKSFLLVQMLRHYRLDIYMPCSITYFANIDTDVEISAIFNVIMLPSNSISQNPSTLHDTSHIIFANIHGILL